MVQCPTARYIWFELLREAGQLQFIPQPDSTLNGWWDSLKGCQPKRKRLELATLSIACCRRLWLERNNRVFDRQVVTEETLIRQICDEFQLWVLARWPAGQHEE
jgi:hypothetical protein